MRKEIVWLLLFLVLLLGLVYLLIPTNITLKQKVRMAVNARGFARVFLHDGSGLPWLANDTGNSSANNFAYNGNTFTLLEKRFSSQLFSVTNGTDSLLAELLVIPFTTDTVEVNFLGAKHAGLNPVTRIQAYFWTKRLNEDFQTLLRKMQSFYTDTKNLYGFQVKKELVDDTTLVSTYTTLKTYPSTADVYALVDRLKAYAQEHNARPADFPMLNITTTQDSSYLTRVAIPLDKRIEGAGDIQVKWMMNRGNILVTEVKGGPAQIQKAFAAMDAYASDHQYATVAIPFQSLVTDRRTVPDTSQWVTKIYWPVM